MQGVIGYIGLIRFDIGAKSVARQVDAVHSIMAGEGFNQRSHDPRMHGPAMQENQVGGVRVRGPVVFDMQNQGLASDMWAVNSHVPSAVGWPV